MPLTNAGRDAIAGRVVGLAGVPDYNNSNSHIGVGNGTGTFAVTQTDLLGVSKNRQPMNAGYPTRASNVLTFRSTFDGNAANYAWEEWGVFNAASGGTMMNRKVENNGTKLSGQTWVLTVTLTVNIGS